MVKLFLHVTQETQDERLQARLDHPWKRWKVHAEDFRNRARREDYLDALKDMFANKNTRWALWQVIYGNHKKAALNAALAQKRVGRERGGTYEENWVGREVKK